MKKNSIIIGLAVISLLTVGCNTGGLEDESYVYEIDPNTGVTGATGAKGDKGDKGGYPNDGGGIFAQGGDRFGEFADNPFVKTSQQSVSTFSVDADGASYAIMRRYKNNGWNIEPASVRIEEFLNYFTFDYASPNGSETIAINAEVGECPWNKEHQLLRLGIKGKELKANETPRANYVFLIDVSGSMNSNDKLPLLKTGLSTLVDQLNVDDRISIITYSGEVEKLLESTPVKDAAKIKSCISKLSASGCTAGGQAMQMAYDEALANYDPSYNNRVIMGTDGDFNVGVTSDNALVEMVENYAKKGIYMTCLGFGSGNLNDAMMEKISNAGNGTYHYIDCEDEMMKVFVHERERFVSVANDSRCQVTFNKDIVSEYRLIGYENRVMNSEDFEDDKKDAGEIGAGQTITALYELVIDNGALKHADANKAFATFDFRYKKSLQSESQPLQLKLTANQITDKNSRSNEYYFAAGVAAYGMILRNSPYKGNADLNLAKKLVKIGLSFDPHGYRAELLKLMEGEKE